MNTAKQWALFYFADSVLNFWFLLQIYFNTHLLIIKPFLPVFPYRPLWIAHTVLPQGHSNPLALLPLFPQEPNSLLEQNTPETK